MPYCPQCGTETKPEAAFCGACGARLEGQASPPPSNDRPPAREAGIRWPLIGGIAALVALAVGGVVLVDAAANDGDWRESLFGGGEDEAIVAAPTPTPPASPQPSPTVEPRPTAAVTRRPSPTVEPTPTEEAPPQEEPTVVPPASGYATPEEAIAALFGEAGVAYVGDCETASLETDVGLYCSFLWEDRFDTLIYVVGFTFSEPDTWLLLAQLGGGDDWTVIDMAEFVPGPQDTVPPWP